MSMPAARSGAVMKYVTDGNAKWNDLGDPYDHLVLPYDPNVDPGCPNNDSYDFVCGKERLVQEISSQINPNEPLVVKRLNAFLSFCHNARKTIINMWLVRMCPRWLEGLLYRLTEPYYKFGKLTTGYVLSAMLEHGFSEEEVLAEKKIPEKPEVDLPNTWNRLKGKLRWFAITNFIISIFHFIYQLICNDITYYHIHDGWESTTAYKPISAGPNN